MLAAIDKKLKTSKIMVKDLNFSKTLFLVQFVKHLLDLYISKNVEFSFTLRRHCLLK